MVNFAFELCVFMNGRCKLLKMQYSLTYSMIVFSFLILSFDGLSRIEFLLQNWFSFHSSKESQRYKKMGTVHI